MLNSVKIAATAALLCFLPAIAGELDQKAVLFKLPDQLNWRGNAGGTQQAVIFGDPNKEGSLYGVVIKWAPNTGSRPHFHPNDRFIYVISGTWWKGTGPKFDPDSTVALPPGSFVKHFGKQVHYDGAKDEDTVLEIVGEGPATSTPAEVK